jgi:Zn-dependent protease/predicted transcriptional regulator
LAAEERRVAFRLLGIDIRLDASWIILALLIAWSLANGVFPVLYAGLPATSYWAMSLATVVGVAISIILHELGHSIVAQLNGVRIRSITLFLFGGVASMEGEPRTARVELLMAIMGPLVSAALAGLFLLLSASLREFVSLEIYGVLNYLGVLNAALAVFNLLPAFPLDGGRVLRAVIWARTGDFTRATVSAARLGEWMAYGVMGLGVLAVLTGGVVGGLWWLILGFFILLMARAHRAQAQTRGLLAGMRVSDVMTRALMTAPGEISVEEFVRDYLARHPHDLVPVIEAGSVIGGAGFKQVKDVPRERWSATSVREIAMDLRDIPVADPGELLADALQLMQQGGASRLLVIGEGRLQGIVTLKDIFAHAQFRAELATS